MDGVTEKGKLPGISVALMLAACLLLPSVGITSAQTGTSTMRGTITDDQGAKLVGATVTLQSVGRDFKRSQTTNEDGGFDFKEVPAGVYSVQAEATGFRKWVAPDLDLAAGKSVVVEIQMAAHWGEISKGTTVRERVADIKPPIAEARPASFITLCGARSYLVKDSAGAYFMFTTHTPDMPHPVTADNPLLSMEGDSAADPASTFTQERPLAGAELGLLVKLLREWRDTAIPESKRRAFKRYDSLKDEAAIRRVLRGLTKEDSDLLEVWSVIRYLEKR